MEYTDKDSDNRKLHEQGEVISRKRNMVQIAIPREVKCTGCKHCSAGEDGKYMLAAAYDPLHADIGDTVIIESGRINQINDGFKLFFLPLLVIIIGFVGAQISGSSVLGFLTGGVLLGVLFIYFKLGKEKYQMKVTEIVESAERKFHDEGEFQ